MTQQQLAQHVLTENQGGVYRIVLNRPEKKNALTFAMYSSMANAITQAENDASVRVILICGSGGNFTSGNDLKDFLDAPPKDESSPVFRFMQAISRAEKPIVAGVAGVAAGIGTTMLLHCDLVYASANAKFLLPFVNLGLCPEAGSSFLLPLFAGHQCASELLLLGEPFSAERAKEIGLVNSICEESQLLDFVAQQARNLASKPAESVRLTKSLLKKANARIVQTTISEEAQLLMARLESAEARAAFASFLNRSK